MRTVYVVFPVRYTSIHDATIVTRGEAPDAWAVYRREPVANGCTEDRWIADFGTELHARTYARACESAIIQEFARIGR